MDILNKLEGLHKQATEERSHYYVAGVVKAAISEITALRARVAELESDKARLDWLIRYARTVEWFEIDLWNPKIGRESLRNDIDKSMKAQEQK